MTERVFSKSLESNNSYVLLLLQNNLKTYMVIAKILGVVLNKLETNRRDYYGYYYHYYYGEDGQKVRK